MSVVWLKSRNMVKYSLSPREMPRAPPLGFPLCSDYILPYIPPLVIIEIQSYQELQRWRNWYLNGGRDKVKKLLFKKLESGKKTKKAVPEIIKFQKAVMLPPPTFNIIPSSIIILLIISILFIIIFNIIIIKNIEWFSLQCLSLWVLCLSPPSPCILAASSPNLFPLLLP